MPIQYGLMNVGTPDGYLFTNSQKIKMTKDLGVNIVRLGVRLDNWRGTYPLLDEYIKAGFKVLLNVGEKTVQKDTLGRKIPNPYCTDVPKFTTELEKILVKYKNGLEGVVIENEPYQHKDFYSGPIVNYIAQLKASVEVAKRIGVKIIDGGLNVEALNSVINGGAIRPNTGVSRNKELLEGYKTCGLDWVNVHTYGKGTSYPTGRIKKVADYLRKELGIPVTSNEWGIYENSPDLVRSMMQQFYDADVLHAIFYNGGTEIGTARAIVDRDGKPLSTGQAFLEMVQKLKPIEPPPPPPCVTVSLSEIIIHNAKVGELWTLSIPVTGTEPFIFSAVNKPSWVSEPAVVSGNIVMSGTPAVGDVGVGIPISFVVTNCAGKGSATFTKTFEVESIPVEPSAEVLEFRKLLNESADVKRLLELFNILLPESLEDDAFTEVANTI